ncbi:hypothetical protein TNCV_1149301 [Trichonephila clavipes]|nr:hypothetical protein TNCV_1149301 [Trichonephila clavipes]
MRDSRFGRRGNMTSNANWSNRTDSSEPPPTSTTGLGAISPSEVTTGDKYIAEKSDLFREAICARNVYAAWARKMTNARPNDPKLQSYHQEVTKAGETVDSLLKQLDVPLFKIPASEKELDKIILRLKNKVNDPPAAKIQEEKMERPILKLILISRSPCFGSFTFGSTQSFSTPTFCVDRSRPIRTQQAGHFSISERTSSAAVFQQICSAH